MSDVMLLGVLRMPLDYVGAPLSPLAQFVARAREAADRIESDAAEITRLRAEVEAMRADAERYRWLRQKIYIDPRQAILRIADTFLLAGDSVPDMLDAAIDAARTEGIKP